APGSPSACKPSLGGRPAKPPEDVPFPGNVPVGPPVEVAPGIALSEAPAKAPFVPDSCQLAAASCAPVDPDQSCCSAPPADASPVRACSTGGRLDLDSRFASRISGGRSFTSTICAGAITVSQRQVFSSWRTLPGQANELIARIAAG